MLGRRLRNFLIATVVWGGFLGLAVLTRSKVVAAAFAICFGLAAVAGQVMRHRIGR